MSNFNWSDDEVKFLRNNVNGMTDKQIAHSLKRTVDSIREKRYLLKIKKSPGAGVTKIDHSNIHK